MLNLLRLLISLVLALAAAGVGAALTVTDDAGRAVTLPGPAQRIVSLAPHITELLFAAGAGEHIVAVDCDARNAVGCRSVRHVGDRRLLGKRDRDRIQVVLAEENDGKLVNTGEV